MKAALLFDLDGTLVDTVYEHVRAWQGAFREAGIFLPAFEIHKRVGMTGPLLTDALRDAFSLQVTGVMRQQIIDGHARLYKQTFHQAQPLPGALELWERLASNDLKWAIATSSRPDEAQVLLEKLHLPDGAVVVTQEDSNKSKPSPEPFEAAAKKLGVPIEDSLIVGDAVWDVLASRRAGAFGIGVLTGGYSREELVAAGAYRVYNDVGELGRKLRELGLLQA